MPVDRFALRPGSSFALLGPRIFEEKSKLTRLARALDDAGVQVEDLVVRKEVHRLRDLGLDLTFALLGLEGDPDNEVYRAAAVRALKDSEVRRGALVDAVPSFLRDEVAHSLDRVAVSEPEIWMEIDAVRPEWKAAFPNHRWGKATPSWKSARGKPRRRIGDPATVRELLDVDTQRPASEEKFFGLKRSRAQERRALPSNRAPLARWFARMPRGWREAVARMHDLDIDASAASDRRAVAERIAQRIVDVAWLRRYLVERLGAAERDLLALVLYADGLPLIPGVEEFTSGFDMHWDWRFSPAPTDGGRLRISGLVHVGQANGFKCAAVPPPLKDTLLDALRHVDPEAASAPDRACRLNAAAIPELAADASPLLVLWKAADRRFSERVDDWLLREFEDGAPRDDACEAFENAMRTARSVAARRGAVDYAVLDWRAAPDQPTLAEFWLPRSRFRSPREDALAHALVAARPALFRVAGIEDRGPVLDPIFPAGPKVMLRDPTLALADDVGRLIAGRAYFAGPFTFFRPLSHSVPGDREPRLLKALARELRDFVRKGGLDDAAALVRARPGLFLRALRSCGR